MSGVGPAPPLLSDRKSTRRADSMSGENVGSVGPPLNCKRLELGEAIVRVNVSRPPSDRGIHKGPRSSIFGERFHQSQCDSRGQQELEHSCGVMPASWAHLRTQWSTALGGLSRFQHAEQIGRPCYSTPPRLRLAVCYAQALVLFHAVVFHVILLHFVLLGLFRLLALHFVLAHVVFHLVLLGLVLFHAVGGLCGRNR